MPPFYLCLVESCDGLSNGGEVRGTTMTRRVMCMWLRGGWSQNGPEKFDNLVIRFIIQKSNRLLKTYNL
jgi:hypothetical protein